MGSQEARKSLTFLLSFLRVMHWHYWTYHWQVKGLSFYGDHLLFERLYSGMPESIDSLAEKIVAMFGGVAVDSEQQLKIANIITKRLGFEQSNLYSNALTLEEMLQEIVESTYDKLVEIDELSLGLDDFLAALANKHETNFYLLQQRVTAA
jgi:DNA-binding ferritin-like protein